MFLSMLSWWEKGANEDVLKRTAMMSMADDLIVRRLCRVGHVQRMDADRLRGWVIC